MYYLGIDGRGRYTGLAMIDDNKKNLGRHSGSSSDLSRLTAAAVSENLSGLIKQLNRLTNTNVRECGGLCFSTDAAIAQSSEPTIIKMFKLIGFNCPIHTISGERALFTAKAGSVPGVLILSGTDVTGAVLTEDNETRYGNYGHLIETSGSTYSVGTAALRRVFMAWDGRAPETALTSSVLRHFNVKTVQELLPIIKDSEFDPLPLSELAEQVKNAAISGDKAALEIETGAARGIASFAGGMLTKLQETKKTSQPFLVMGGSALLLNESIYRQAQALIRTEFPGITILSADERPELGAAMLAIPGNKSGNK